MNRAFIFKVIGIFLLTMLMSWAVTYINSLITERQSSQESVKHKISSSYAGSQTIIGPVLAVPYTEEYYVKVIDNEVKKVERHKDEYIYYLLPDNLELAGGFTNEYKKLGIYKALMYQLGGNIKGSFSLPANYEIKPQHEGGVISYLPAYVSIGISDTRGINGKPELTVNSETYQFEQGTNLSTLGNGIHAYLGTLNIAATKNIHFEFKLNLRGMENFNFTPIADSNKIALQSSWQHPHFNGSFLPDAATQKITPAGFQAQWEVSSLSSSNQTILLNMLNQGWNGKSTATSASAIDSARASYPAAAQAANSNQSLESLSIGFVEPINVYSQSDRATKYGLLFIGLTFAGFFIFEIIKRLRIHPAQYTLVGLAMALFYLLLISLSEHISFAMSYLIASLSCVSLLGYYLTYVLKSKGHGFMFAGLLTALYGALYGILASEDNALLMGSLLVFGLLAVTMIITRKVDWYQISSKEALTS
ncbi:MAG: cell envelope integrity protein CreD [Methylotenera sp.]|uniref:cell envelope integrity protein CreD n=1 Tax=Methylotenera sp. TaxID=2051956 RepID=UPI002487F47F|nr:cell envelope integrity protein CreD [Methylotenera sp.]MDI1308251.1 cell envelope integrity protein CreD [Methylotenera sp.]